MTSIDRRVLLTHGAIGGAALTLTSAAALASVGEDAGLLEHGERCKALPLETTRLGKLFRKASERVEKHFSRQHLSVGAVVLGPRARA